VIRERAGLRPFRPSVRLEHDREEPRIVHNYGHGGAGYTLCWGCSQEVVRLLKLAR
jgi:D-amino-acid oxidase